MESNMLLEANKAPLKASFQSQQYNIALNQNQAQNEPNFRTILSGKGAWLRLGNISEKEKIEIIKLGFRLNQEGKISLKNYYQGVNQVNSLSQLKGYRIKYETIRRTKLYQQLKSNFI